MKKLAITLYMLFYCFLLSAQNIKQKEKDHWEKVNKYILANWESQKGASKDLPKPYISVWPGLPFMFYWDTYFTNKGLMLSNLGNYAKNNTENLLYAVDKFGYVGNAFVTDWGMNRSQPPYLSEMVKDLYQNQTVKDTVFLKNAYYTLLKEYQFWTDTSAQSIENHQTSVKGLQRFYHHATDKELIALYGQIAGRFNLDRNISDSNKVKIATPYAVEAGTGMDFTPRFENRCQDFIAVELNTLLYTYEVNFNWIEKELNFKSQYNWLKMAKQRKKLINKYCWNKKRGLYLDYDFTQHRSSKVLDAITFQPLWAGIASKNQAKKVVKNMHLLETEFGISSVEECGETKSYQWGRASLWPPMQLIAIQGLNNYGYKAEAQRLALKYLNLVSKNFANPVPNSYVDGNKTIIRQAGKTYEKYKIDGNLNDDEYPSSEMMGWTTGCFLWCYEFVNQ